MKLEMAVLEGLAEEIREKLTLTVFSAKGATEIYVLSPDEANRILVTIACKNGRIGLKSIEMPEDAVVPLTSKTVVEDCLAIITERAGILRTLT